MMCHMERRHGHMKPVIKKALVELDGLPFNVFAAQRDDWAKYDLYRSPGPIQFAHSGSGAFDPAYKVELSITLTLELLKADARMNSEHLEAAKAVQDAAPRYGHFKFSPLVGKANAVWSENQQARALYKPELCPALADKAAMLTRCVSTQPTQCPNSWDKEGLLEHFPNTYGLPLVAVDKALSSSEREFSFRSSKKLRHSPGAALNVGVVFCGRQTPGGHDVIAGLFDALPQGSKLYGFVDGTLGLLAGHAVEITAEILENYRGQGGYDLLGRSVDRIRHTPEEHDKIAAVCKKWALHGLLLMGGPRTQTDAAYLAEYVLRKEEVHTAVVTVPLIFNGSIRNQFVETTVGFDTATKMTSQIIGKFYECFCCAYSLQYRGPKNIAENFLFCILVTY